MKTVLNQLFNGEIYPAEQTMPENEEYSRINQKVFDRMEHFKNTLPEETYRETEQLVDLLSEASSIEEEIFFISGFTWGALLLIEIMQHRDGLT